MVIMVMLVITETMVRLVILVSTVALVITFILVILVRWQDSQAATATGATWGKRRGRPLRLCSPGKEKCSFPTVPSSKYPLKESRALNNLQHFQPLIPPASLTSLSTTPCRGRRRRWRWWPTSSWSRQVLRLTQKVRREYEHPESAQLNFGATFRGIFSL